MANQNIESKIVIHVHTGVSESEAVTAVQKVIEMGKICAKNTAYAYVSHPVKGLKVVSAKAQYGHKFHVSKFTID